MVDFLIVRQHLLRSWVRPEADCLRGVPRTRISEQVKRGRERWSLRFSGRPGQRVA
jgi:hypothetical protein